MTAFGVEIDESQVCIIPGNVTKQQVLDKLIGVVSANPGVTDKEAFRRAVYEREAVSSTGIGNGIAIPHVRIPEVTSLGIGVGIVPEGVDFGALDGQPVRLLILFSTPQGANKEYLKLLARVMLALRDRDFFDQLVASRKPAEAAALLNA